MNELFKTYAEDMNVRYLLFLKTAALSILK